MPSFRHVGFAAKPSMSRLPNAAEAKAIHNFGVHASHCDVCADPYAAHLAGRSLCDRGHHHAREVARHLYNKAGRACSTVERSGEYQAVQVEIPVVGAEPVRGLLKAIERGLRLRRSKAKPVVSYDRTYYVAPRPVVARQPVAQPAVERRAEKARARIQIVDPPRPSAHHQHAEKVIYLEDLQGPHGRGMKRQHREDGAVVVYAAPRAPYRVDRRASIYETEFYR
ncbi:MAG: hypothetical protein M1832_001473 [Thelocarpon impressellum]|nr:MAG: hypothetical protein M1832_001473 [Thelocarpon impressellum]